MNQYEKEQQIVEWIQDYDAYKAGIKNLNQAIDDIAEEGMGIRYDKEAISPTNKFNSVVENAVLKIDKLNLRKRIKTMASVISAIDNALESLKDIEREVVIKRCKERKYYYQFCYDICISERTAKRVKKEALRKMSVVIFGKD